MHNETRFTYPEIARLTASPIRKFALIFASALFVLAGIWMLASGKPEGWVGWIGIIVFGFCLILAILSALPNASGLIVMKEGFATRNLFRTDYYAWSDVSEFSVFTLRMGHAAKQMVVFRAPTAARWAPRLSSFLTGGYTHALADTYGVKADRLADDLNAYRRDALKNAEPADSIREDA